MKFKETALILAGHGSTKNKDSSRHTRETARRLQKRGIFKEVRAGFWKESPSFQEVFHGLEAKEAIVVPWFLTRGYFVEKVLSEQLSNTPIPSRILDPIGARPEIVQLMRSRALKLTTAPARRGWAHAFARGWFARFFPSPSEVAVGETSLSLALVRPYRSSILGKLKVCKKVNFKGTALILAGHGSTKNADSSRHTRETARRLQKRGIS